MSYYGGTITVKGRDLITSLIAGETIEFTRIVVGSGEMPTDLPQLPTDSYRGDLRIYSLHKPNDNKY